MLVLRVVPQVARPLPLVEPSRWHSCTAFVEYLLRVCRLGAGMVIVWDGEEERGLG